MEKIINPKLKPLITDLKAITDFKYYLASSDFERLAVQSGFATVWEIFYLNIKNNRRVILPFEHKPFDCEDTFIDLLDAIFKDKEKKSFNNFVNVFFGGFIDCLKKELDFDNIFADLEVIDFPEDELIDLKSKLENKNSELKNQRELKELKTLDQITDNEKYSKILETKRLYWIDKISKAETEEAINSMKNFAFEMNRSDLISEIVNQSQRWHRLQGKVRQNIINSDEEHIECNKINKALLDLISKITSQK